MATRHLSMDPANRNARERFLDAALNVLLDRGLAGLSVRAVAELAGASPISVYTRFGGRAGVIEALYERTFDLLREMFEGLPPQTADGIADLLTVAAAYRRFAHDSPARYTLMFERPVAGFNPDPALRSTVVRTAFGQFIMRVSRVCPAGTDPRSAGYSLWAVMHGLVSAELTIGSKSPLTGWYLLPTEAAHEEIYLTGVRSMIGGLALRNPGFDPNVDSGPPRSTQRYD